MILDHVTAKFREFKGTEALHDDETIVLIKVKDPDGIACRLAKPMDNRIA